MELESYFDFLPDGVIRIKGHRINLEHVVYEYNQGMSMEELLERFPSLSKEKIQACLDYYLAHRQEVDDFIRRSNEEFEELMHKNERNPRHLALKKKIQAAREKLALTSPLPSNES